MAEKDKAAATETHPEASAQKSKAAPAADKFDLGLMVERTTERIAFLKRQHEELQKQKIELEELSRQRKELDAGRREVIASLEHAVAVLDSEENDLQRKHGLVQTTKAEFKKILKEVHSIHEEGWAAENVKDEINHALALVAKARNDFVKAQGQIEALTARNLERGQESHPVAARLEPPAAMAIAELFKRSVIIFLPAALLALLVVLIVRLLS